MMDPKRKRLYMIIGAVIAIVIAVAAGYLYYMRTPTYTLRTIGNAVKTHDWASFQKHVDVKGIFNNTYDRMIESEAAKQQGPDAQLMRGFATLLHSSRLSLPNCPHWPSNWLNCVRRRMKKPTCRR